MNKKVDSRLAPQAAPKRLRGIRAALKQNFTAQAVAAVALPYALVFPLLHAGWLDVPSFVVIALLFSIGAMIFLARRLASSVAALRAALRRFGASQDLDETTNFSITRSSGLDGLQRSIENMHRRVVLRQFKLKTARDVAERESASTRSLAEQLARAQRIARVGQWERDLKTDLVIWSDKIPNICQGLSNFSAPCDAERLFYSTPR